MEKIAFWLRNVAVMQIIAQIHDMLWGGVTHSVLPSSWLLSSFVSYLIGHFSG